jgi:hypothetical protein
MKTVPEDFVYLYVCVCIPSIFRDPLSLTIYESEEEALAAVKKYMVEQGIPLDRLLVSHREGTQAYVMEDAVIGRIEIHSVMAGFKKRKLTLRDSIEISEEKKGI